jgi:carboxyl-terminal processing protease
MKSLLFIKMLIILLMTSAHAQQEASTQDEITKISEVINLISTNYTDTVNKSKLIDGTIRLLLEQLDPHSVYRTPKEAKDDAATLYADHKGIGVTFRYFDDTLTVVAVAPQSPAQKAGIRPGMKVNQINKVTVTNRILTAADIKNIINKNLNDDTINLSYFKKKSIKNIIIIKDTIRDNSIESHYAPNDSTIYIRIKRFTKNTYSDFDNVISIYNRKNRRNIIIDLRDNPGGALSSSIQICNQFIADNMLILSTRGLHQQNTNYFANSDGKLKTSRVCIIINENSASASEVVASSIQDSDRGIVIGRRSYGKGLTQQIIPLCDGSNIRLSNSRLYSPSGRCIQKQYIRGNSQDYFGELANRKKRLENICPDSIITDGLPTYQTVIKHRTVYGEMGVVPDLFVAEDTTSLPDFWESWKNCGTLENFVYEYMNTYRDTISSNYGTFKKFIQNFTVNDNIMDSLLLYAVTDTTDCLRTTSTSYKAAMMSPAGKLMKTYIKALIARSQYGLSEFRQVLNADDNDVKTAINLVNNPTEYWKYIQ